MSRLNKNLQSKKRHMYMFTLSQKTTKRPNSGITKFIPCIPPSFPHVL